MRGIYGRFDSKIRFEIESDGRFDSNAKKTIRRSLRTQPKNTNPKPGFQLLLNPGFGFGKVAGFPRGPGFSTPGFQSLVTVHD